MELHEYKQDEAVREAILRYYISPQMIKRVLDFAEAQRAAFVKFDGNTGCFHFSDGEAYTGEAILEFFGIPAPKNIFVKND